MAEALIQGESNTVMGLFNTIEARAYRKGLDDALEWVKALPLVRGNSRTVGITTQLDALLAHVRKSGRLPGGG